MIYFSYAWCLHSASLHGNFVDGKRASTGDKVALINVILKILKTDCFLYPTFQSMAHL